MGVSSAQPEMTRTRTHPSPSPRSTSSEEEKKEVVERGRHAVSPRRSDQWFHHHHHHHHASPPPAMSTRPFHSTAVNGKSPLVVVVGVVVAL